MIGWHTGPSRCNSGRVNHVLLVRQNKVDGSTFCGLPLSLQGSTFRANPALPYCTTCQAESIDTNGHRIPLVESPDTGTPIFQYLARVARYAQNLDGIGRLICADRIGNFRVRVSLTALPKATP